MNISLQLDHVGLATRQLDRARGTYTRLGFTLSPRSMHAGTVEPGGPVVPWGSGNHCAMFQSGYFELLGLVDASLPSSVKHMVDRHEGLHVVALACDSAQDAYAQARAAQATQRAPVDLERDVPEGPSGLRMGRARFRNVYLDEARYPEGRLILIEHRTPELLWQPHLLSHPNGAEALTDVVMVPTDLGEAASRYQQLLGLPQRLGQLLRFAMQGQGSLWLASEAALRQRVPVLRDAAVWPLAAAGIRVRSLPDLERLLLANGIPCQSSMTLDGSRACLWVAPEHAQQTALAFTSD